MAKKTTELFTPYTQRAALAEPRPPRLVRVRRLQEYGGQEHYYLDGWPRPVPAWIRHFDGWTVGAVVRLAAVALTAAVAFVVWLLRLLGRAR